MSREYKFRAWDEKQNKMYSWEHMTTGYLIGFLTGYYKDTHTMQFTGLRDSKRTEEYPEGQEVYEDDLLFDGEQTWVVEYSKTSCGFHARDINSKSCNIFSLYHLCNRHNNKRGVSVVGNIHETEAI